MLNLFQHPTRLARLAYIVGCRNKFGMTSPFLIGILYLIVIQEIATFAVIIIKK